MRKSLFALLMIFGIAGLTTTRAYGEAENWEKIDAPTTHAIDKSYQIDIPHNWVKLTGQNGLLVFSKDGPAIQRILTTFAEHKMAYPAQEKASSVDMLPTELATLAVAELKQYKSLSAIETVSSRPAVIDGHKGYKLHLRYKNGHGLRYERILYGFVTKDGLYELMYEAPTLTFFKRDLPVFEAAVKSFKLNARISAATTTKTVY